MNSVRKMPMPRTPAEVLNLIVDGLSDRYRRRIDQGAVVLGIFHSNKSGRLFIARSVDCLRNKRRVTYYCLGAMQGAMHTKHPYFVTPLPKVPWPQYEFGTGWGPGDTLIRRVVEYHHGHCQRTEKA
ncbi:MAG: hypothetical protein IT443_11975 [Phycisphaeraceae bacterium]|nr:hypothetical protein [Phycisphaeraceae bacterium]